MTLRYSLACGPSCDGRRPIMALLDGSNLCHERASPARALRAWTLWLGIVALLTSAEVVRGEEEGVWIRGRKQAPTEIALPTGTVLSAEEQEATELPSPSNGAVFWNTVDPRQSDTKKEVDVFLIKLRALSHQTEVENLVRKLKDAKILSDLADGTLLAKLSTYQAQNLKNSPRIAWIGQYDWRDKLGKDISQLIKESGGDPTICDSESQHAKMISHLRAKDPDADKFLSINDWAFADLEVYPFLDDDMSTIVSTVRDLGCTVDSEPLSRNLRIPDVPLAWVCHIAKLPEVEKVLLEETFQTWTAGGEVVAGGEVSVSKLLDLNGIRFKGSGQIVAHSDSGISAHVDSLSNHPDLDKQVVNPVEAYGRDGDWSDLTGHGTMTAGLIVGTGTESSGEYRGIAPGARLFHQSLGDDRGGLGGLNDDGFLRLFESALEKHASIHSNSWGKTKSEYDGWAHVLDEWAWNGGHPSDRKLLLIFAAGNLGQENSISSPALAKNCLAVGAVESSDTKVLWPASSRGPAPGKRIKPDLVAPGNPVMTIRPPSLRPLIYSSMEGEARGWQIRPPKNKKSWRLTNIVAHSGQSSLRGKYTNDEESEIRSPAFFPFAAKVISFFARWKLPPSGIDAVSMGFLQGHERVVVGKFKGTNAEWPGWHEFRFKIPETIRNRPRETMFFVRLITGSEADEGIFIDDFQASAWGDEGDPDRELKDISEYYILEKGTSMAAPIVAGLAALHREFLQSLGQPDPSSMLLKASLINGARPLGSDSEPTNEFGWGLASTDLLKRRVLVVIDGQQVTSTEPDFSQDFIVPTDGGSVVAALVWWDMPGHDLRNDLDLTLTGPASAGGFSARGLRDNTARITIPSAQSGNWNVTVAAERLDGERRIQEFALIISSNARHGEQSPSTN